MPAAMYPSTRSRCRSHGERAHLRLGIERIADPYRRQSRRQRIDQGVMASTRNDQARDGCAGLAGHADRRHRERVGNCLDVVVVEDHAGRLPTQLEGASSEAFTTEGRDPAPGHRRTGEGDLVDPRIAHERLADLSAGGDAVQDPRRQPDRFGHFGEHVHRAHRLGRRLQHDRAAGEQCGRHLERGSRHGRVPGNDRAHDTDGFTDEQRGLGAVRGGVRLHELERVGHVGVRSGRSCRRPVPSGWRTTR